MCRVLREVLYQDKSRYITFLDKLEARGRKLPVIPNKFYHENIFQDSKTPYFDMIEFMNFNVGF